MITEERIAELAAELFGALGRSPNAEYARNALRTAAREAAAAENEACASIADSYNEDGNAVAASLAAKRIRARRQQAEGGVGK